MISSHTARPREYLSMTGRSTIPIAEHNRQINHCDLGGSYNHPRTHRADINGNHNQVVIGRVQAGLDVRTTVSLPFCSADPF